MIRRNEPEDEESSKITPDFDWTDKLNEITMFKYKIIEIVFEQTEKDKYSIENISIKVIKSFIGPHIN